MTNRAHHPADRGSGEFTKDDPNAPDAGEPAPAGMDEAVSREFALPPDVERALARAADADEDDDDDAEEVVPEPESGNGALSATATEGARTGSEPPLESGERTDAAGAVAAIDAPPPAPAGTTDASA